MDISNSIDKNLDLIHNILPVKKSYDIVERTFVFGGKKAVTYFINGFIKDDIMEEILRRLLSINNQTMDSFNTIEEFMTNEIPHVSVVKEKDIDKIVFSLLCGQTILYVDSFDYFIILDLRTYPGRDSAEPAKEKTLRGSKDAFVEKLVLNSALIRRQIRDPNLIFEVHTVGTVSKTDVCITYLKDTYNKKAYDLIMNSLNKVDVRALTVGAQSLVDTMQKKNFFNPFPKVRYTERPDTAAAHIVEGKIVILIDNSPIAIILPTGIFDFTQDINDYFFPLFTGNYLKLMRNLTLLFTIILTPLYVLYIDGHILLPEYFDFLKPKDVYQIPMFLQFMILELSIDALKLASLNTPSTLGSSLSIVGGLIIGEYTVSTGWFTNQSILYMAVVAIAGFSQPSIEMGFALKFMRMMILLLSGLFNWWGFIGGIIAMITIMASTKTVIGEPYFYPLIPFNWKKLKNLIFRTRLSKNTQ
ncbi:spore germination protein [Clostridium sp. BJN0001]|uniref:spore germination protein n=1 Tax=Clostridium sp. BJN0001 TaxID=2930219 RepID=UPI001FD17A68|nr:spore germination protein [Clostridium sp. BJN0001]